MAWVESFYSQTGQWWGRAESAIGPIDRWRASLLVEVLGSWATRSSVLELGCGYGASAKAMADLGFAVTAIDLSDRIASAVARDRDNPSFLKADFYEVELSRDFHCVCYWDGFGVGGDDDQRRLLQRISGDWLRPDGTAVVEVYNPFWWCAQAGFEETKLARPEDGYPFDLGHRRDFDTSTCRALDSWWEIGSPTEVWTQSLRCYSPADLSLLVQGSGLRIESLRSASTANNSEATGNDDGPSYLSLLVHE